MTRSKPISCMGCALHTHGTDFTSVEGAGTNGVLLVGESSGEHEQRDGLPFRPYAPSGAVLERCLRRMGMDRKSFAITNTVRCRPRKNWLEGSPWEFAALRACRPNLDAVIQQHRPRCVVALGGVAMRELTGCAGEAQGVGHLAGYVLPRVTYPRGEGPGTETGEPTSIPVICDFHPSYLRRGKASYQGVFSRIIQRGVRIASGADRDFAWGIDPADDRTWGMPGGGRLQYWTRPTTDDARSVLNYLRDNPNLWVAKDIETSESSSLDEDARDGFTDTHVRQFQLSYQPGTGIAIPYTGEFRPIIRELLHLRNPTFGHNWDNFDHKVLRACAAREGWEYAPRERVFDTLDMFHHWQPDLPAHLQFCASFVNFPFPWKHLAGSHIEFYGICDVDADLRLGMFLEKALKKDGIWGDGDSYSIVRGYTGQEREVRPVLAGMEDRGVPVDDGRRIALGAEFDAAQKELGAELGLRAPDACKRVHPKTGYKGIPPVVKKSDSMLWEGATAPFIMDGRFPDPPIHEGKEAEWEGEWYTYQRRQFADGDKWCRVYEFNPNSAPQLVAYMKAKSHPIPKGKEEDDEGNTKDTTAKKELIRLAHKTGDTFYLKVIEYRELAKAKGTYVDGFRPGAGGRVHTTFTFDTATAQTSSRNPNVQNFLKHGRLAKATRGIIAAPEGYTLAEADFKSYHVLTTGFEAECAEYMRMARLDMHSFIAGIFTRQWGAELMEQPDDALLEKFAWFKQDAGRKRVRDKQAKPSILGVGFGMKKRRLFQENMEHYANEAEAGKFLAILEDVFRPVFDWQTRVQKQAHEQAFLKSRFGHIRRFYEVFRWDGRKGVWGHGDQAEEAVAFLPANHAFGNIRECMKAQQRLGIAEKYGLCNSIHDSFVYVFPTRMREEFLSEVVPVLRAPSAVLTHPVLAPRGLEVDVEVAWGSDWASLKDVPLASVAAQEAACAR